MEDSRKPPAGRHSTRMPRARRPRITTSGGFSRARLSPVPLHVASPTVVQGVGEKVIRELVGRVNTGTEGLSVARMTSPPGWEEPAQTPEFDEVTLVLEGAVVVEHDGGMVTVRAGEAMLARAGERVRYSTPEGAEYVAICVPAFTPEAAYRES